MEEEVLHMVFKKKLEDFYGDYQQITSKFGTNSFGKISSDLCISSSQFSKLISGSATEGMYIRSIRNIEQLEQLRKLTKETKSLKKELKKLRSEDENSTNSKKRSWVLFVIIGCLIGVLIGYFAFPNKLEKKNGLINSNSEVHPLGIFFNDIKGKTIDTGFLNEEDVQEYCPSSAFEGHWKLKETYTIPLPGSKKPGVYLLAKSADVTMVASKYAKNKGRVVLGLEHLTHEVWLDKTRESLIPKYFDPEKTEFTKAYKDLDFGTDESFVRIAEIKSFYMDEFTIHPDFIIRKGQPSGRYISFIDEELSEEHGVDIDYILKEVISDLVKTRCESTLNDYCNPNHLKEGSTISFNCFYSIDLENLGFGGGYPYTKTLELVKKSYSDNLICDCSE